MVSEIAQNYKILLQLLPDIIDISGYRNDYLSKKLNLNPKTFSVKKKRGSWSVDEMVTLMSILQNEDVEDFLLLQLMRESKDETVISADEFRKEIHGWK